MDIKVFRSPSSQDYQYPKIERVKEDTQQKNKKDDKQQKKKKDEKMDGIFSSLAQSLGQQDDFGY